ncbi:prolyl endopeptidase-like [Cloeon dipterum]|uniref:prolyl endopeptidase-like n=1 Tax=Cloeon dipterum TaxID=197152 RepID=UPI00321FE60E
MAFDNYLYPVARRDEIVDNYHGNMVTDPYRWLENPNSPERMEFVERQNAITQPYLENFNDRQKIKSRLRQLMNFPCYSCSLRRGDRYYFSKSSGLQNRSVLYVQDGLYGEAKVFLDPNELSKDGSMVLTQPAFSEDGKTMCYGLSKSGSDWTTIHFRDTETGLDYPEVLEKVKISPLTWSHDNKGIFYAMCLEKQGKVAIKYQQLYYHRVNTPRSEDVLVVQFLDDPCIMIDAVVCHCGNYLIVLPLYGKGNMVFFAKIGSLPDGPRGPLPLTQIVHKMESGYEYVTNVGSEFIFRTNKDAPNYRLVSIDLKNPRMDQWRTLVAEHPKDVLKWAVLSNKDKLVVCYFHDVKSVLQIRDLATGDLITQLPLDNGMVSGVLENRKYPELFFEFYSFLTPGVIYMCDLSKPIIEPVLYRKVELKDFDASLYITKQVFYGSKDGTIVPLFIVHKKDLKRDGSSPCLLYGYGGFGKSILPTFHARRLVFMQHFNGVFAVANIRGGGEYGESWHNAGRLFNKQNGLDDFQAAAEYLISARYTSSAHLTIEGGLIGGLLVGACINQRPQLFGAAIVQFGVLDLVHFCKVNSGTACMSEYCNPDDLPQISCYLGLHFRKLLDISPLHNIRVPDEDAPKNLFERPSPMQYPATLLLTADHKEPLHSLKFIAQLQHTLRYQPVQMNPLLIKVQTKAGRGNDKPTTADEIEWDTDILSFIGRSLNIECVF